MQNLSDEIKVGFLITLSLSLIIFFAWIIGIKNPFGSNLSFYITYQFAGGIEIGSPVRLSGIKIGKVEKIDFFIDNSKSSSEDQKILPLKIKVSVTSKAQEGIRKDSQFYINLAGIIGERYIEITPGSKNQPVIQNDDTLIGIDPPRIDQLISQSFNLAGKVIEILDNNKSGFHTMLENLNALGVNIQKTLHLLNTNPLLKKDMSLMIDNLIIITNELQKVLTKANSTEVENTLKTISALIKKLEPVDQKTIKNFFQQEGIRVKIF